LAILRCGFAVKKTFAMPSETLSSPTTTPSLLLRSAEHLLDVCSAFLPTDNLTYVIRIGVSQSAHDSG
jgi:hypothetical protein